MLSCLKVGTIGFGGGMALIPVIEREFVGNKKWLEKERFDVTVAVSSISPASIPVALCAIWDSRYSIVSAYAYALPGPFIYLILLSGFSCIGDIGSKYLRFASVGLIAFVLFLLYRFIRDNYSHCEKQSIKEQYLCIMTASFILTSGNVLGRLAALLLDIVPPTPIFSIDTITLMLATFFIICFIGASRSKAKLAVAIILAVTYTLTRGKAGILGNWALPLAGIMILLTAGSVYYDVRKKRSEEGEKRPFHFDFKPLRNLIVFILIAVLLTSATFFLTGDANVLDFAFRAVTSSLMSFGGGEVYIGISEAIFVQTGFIPEEIYSTQIMGIANTMPGPVLVSILTGVGYTYGYLHHGTAIGWLFGVLAISLAVTATAFGALILLMCFDILRESERLKMVIKYIIPVVCGMLISTAISLLRQASIVLVGERLNAFLSVGIVLLISLLMIFLHKKFRVSDIALLLIAGAGAVSVLGVMDYLV